MRRLVFAVVVATQLAYAQDATVDTITYRVKDGDTLALIAAEHYGDRRKAIFIMVKNRLAHNRKLRQGERLKIPINRVLTTSPNDTFETIAASLLGDSRRGVFLAEFNNMSPDEQLPAGTVLQIPFTVTHKAEATESFASIGAAYFNDKSQGEMLRRYNFMDKSALEKDESIQVPIYNVRLQASKMPAVDAGAKSRQEARREALKRAATQLPRAWHAWRSGDVTRIETLLFGIDIDFLDTADAVEVSVLRGLAAAADGKRDLAIGNFRTARARKPSHVLREFDYSPKILELWAEAGKPSE